MQKRYEWAMMPRCTNRENCSVGAKGSRNWKEMLGLINCKEKDRTTDR